MLTGQMSKVIFIDELDRRLHTHVSRHILKTFLNATDGDKHNQLIVTTHDTNLQDLELLRRDEIWYADKTEHGATKLYSLAEFKVRPDLRIERSYLNGRFGAIPRRTLPAVNLHTPSAA
jgi:AAA15 family ATPase/GTPase